jgi:EAL domain-containing protein (putative c-di-GMP-specific phosphodiesterase class I)
MTGLDPDVRAAAGRESPGAAIQRILRAARAHYGMDVAFVSEFADGRRVFRFVDSDLADSIVQVGGGDPLEESYCQRVVDGRLPQVIPDAQKNIVAATLPVTAALPVGAHLSVPIELSDGTVYGTLCCFKAGPDSSLSERDGAIMHLFASLLAGYLHRLQDAGPQPDAPTGPPPEPPVETAQDQQLQRMELVAWPAVGVLSLGAVWFSVEHLTGSHPLPRYIETAISVAGLVSVAILAILASRFRAVATRLVTSSVELARRDAMERAADDVFAARHARILEVLAARDSLRMVFQPIFSLSDGSLVGHEALARFVGDRTPDAWFREAHDVGLGVELELRAVTEAIDRFDFSEGYLSVNVSPDALRSSALQNFLKQSPDACRLVLELTEHAVIEDYEIVSACIADVRHLGTRLAVDDAGSGFASMRHIIDLAPDIVKIDRSIIDHVDTDPSREALVESLVRFAIDIGATVVAEGVERSEERDACRRLGVHSAQGYLLGRPADQAHRPAGGPNGRS